MTTAPNILLVDDDEDLREALGTALELAELRSISVADGDAALAAFDQHAVDVVVSDIRMPGLDGRQLLQRLLARDPELPVILMTGHGDIDQAVAALHQGAYDFLAKPFATERLIESVRRALEKRQLTAENRRLRSEVARQSEQQQLPLMGSSPAVQRLVHAVTQIGETGIDVLIEGEWGTGKQAVAQILARAGHDRWTPIQPFACEALPEKMLETALFGKSSAAGQRRGNDTGGALGAAKGGVLLLIGVEALPLPIQSRLLHSLRQRAIDGADEPTASLQKPMGDHGPTRVISTTTANLPDMVSAGAFRADLFFRLAPVRLVVPPLRERSADIPLLFMQLLETAAKQYQRAVPELTDSMLARLMNHDWPGNLRELQNFADQAVLNLERTEARLAQGDGAALSERVAAFEAEAICAALRAEAGSITASCTRLGLPRKTLYDKLAKYGIKPAEFRP